MKRVLEPEVMADDDEAVAYEAMDHTEPNTAFVRRLVERRARGRMLDVGTGPGHIPVLVAAAVPGSAIVAIDQSAPMLAIARRRCRRAGVEDRVTLLLADAKALPFGDGAFDAVFSNTTLHHIPEPVPFLAGLWRVLRPGGVLLVRDLFRPASVGALDTLVSRHAGGDSPCQRKLFRDSLRAALTPAELRAAAAEAGMRGVEVVVDTDRHMSLQGVKPAVAGAPPPR